MHPTLLALALQVANGPAAASIEVDGRLDEAFWKDVPIASEFHQQRPQAGGPAPYSTQVQLARDTEHLYIGVVMQDPPGTPRQSNFSRRDHIPATDDSLTLILDSLGTRVFGQVFQVNPDCAINDGIYKEAALATDFSSDFLFSVACHADAKGWSVEFKIPLQELRFDQSSTTPWNLLVQRNLVRDQPQAFANAPLPRDPLCLLCQAPSLEMAAALPDPNFLRITPYVLLRRTDRDEARRGVDVKYRLDSSSVLDATFNPDFSQVNLDEPQLSANTRFAISTLENRPFFLEGADILETPLKVIATRSITEPSWGLKYTRRRETQDTMLILGDDRSKNRILLPGPYRSRYESVDARQKYFIGATQWKHARTQFGLNITHRAYEGQGFHQTLGATAWHFFTSEDSLRSQVVMSQTGKEGGAAGFLLYQHKGPAWHSSVELKSYGADFRTDLGFNPRNNYRLGIVTNTWHQDFGTTHLASYVRLSRKYEFSPRPMQIQNAPGVTLTGWHGMELTLETRPGTLERIREGSTLHRYQQQYASLGLYPGSILTWLQCDLTWGERLDVTDDRVRPGRAEGCSARLALGKTIEWNGSYNQERLHGGNWLDSESPVLINQVVRHLLVIPWDQNFSLRYIRQDERAQRISHPLERTQTDSWNISYENPANLTLHAGATIARTEDDVERDYYLKLSATLP